MREKKMSNYNKEINHDIENISEIDCFECMSKENLKLFKRALSEAIEAKIRKTEEETKDMETPLTSKRHKIRMNRLFRERVGGTFIPFPEVDNFHERARSNLIVKLKINEFLDHHKERKGAR